MKENNNSDRKS